VLALLVISLSIHFSRSPVFFYALLVSIANISLGVNLTETPLVYALLSAFMPLLLLLFTVLPDRGIVSIRAIPAYAILASAVLFSFLMTNLSPQWLTQLLLTDWLPARYFDWTQQSQSILFISITMFIAMLVLYFLHPSPQTSAGLGVLIMLVAQLHFGNADRSLHVFSTIALLMCLYAVLQDSWRMAYLDELTELPARRALREKFQKIGGTYSVAMLDVDHFKKFNDSYGHDTGDAVLRMIATRLTRVSGGGYPYRYGGEEFSVVFNGKDAEEARPHLEALRETIASTPFIINRASRRKSDNKGKRGQKKSVNVTVSIGLADSKSGSSSPWDVLKLADKALYRAKGKGRNCVCS
jgi:diguanylate cyclase (GGDEF)-like protein